MRTTIAAIALVLLAPIACRKADRQASTTPADTMPATSAAPSAVSPSATGAASTAPSRGNIAISTTDSGVTLALVSDTVRMGLSDKIQNEVHRDLDTSKTDTSSKFGAMIDKMVKKTVSGALSTAISYPLSDIKDVQYEDGEIKFSYNHKHAFSFESVRTDKKKALESFAPADAERFVAAVRAAKAQGR